MLLGLFVLVAIGLVILSRGETAAEAATIPVEEYAYQSPAPQVASARGRRMIQNFEGLHLTAYPEPNGSYSIGYGHNSPAIERGDVITRAQAEAFFEQDLAQAEAAVRELVSAPLAQAQVDALVSLVYNIGAGNFASSTLRAKLNAGDEAGAAAEFSRWTVGGAGLVSRRAQEAALFRQGVL